MVITNITNLIVDNNINNILTLQMSMHTQKHDTFTKKTSSYVYEKLMIDNLGDL